MKQLHNKRFLSIAGCSISLVTESDYSISFDYGYNNFIVNEPKNLPNITIEVFSFIPLELQSIDTLVFETNDETKKLWTVCKHNEAYKIIAYNPLKADVIQQIAIISIKENTWEIYCEPNDEKVLMPLSYPMGPLIMYYLTLANNAIMIHSSGVVDGEKGRLFSGFSGVGKSTMAGIWFKNGNTIINDDRLFLRIVAGKVMMHNTPMFYEDEPKSNQLNAIYLLKQTKENCIRRLTDAEAISRLLAFCIQHGYDKEFMEHHLSTIFDIYSLIPIYELGFKPDAEIIDFIRSHES